MTIEATPPPTATTLRHVGGTMNSNATTTEKTAVVCPLGRLLWVAGVTSLRARSGRDSRWFFSSQAEALAASSNPTATAAGDPLQPRQREHGDNGDSRKQRGDRDHAEHRVDRTGDTGVREQRPA